MNRLQEAELAAWIPDNLLVNSFQTGLYFLVLVHAFCQLRTHAWGFTEAKREVDTVRAMMRAADAYRDDLWALWEHHRTMALPPVWQATIQHIHDTVAAGGVAAGGQM